MMPKAKYDEIYMDLKQACSFAFKMRKKDSVP